MRVFLALLIACLGLGRKNEKVVDNRVAAGNLAPSDAFAMVGAQTLKDTGNREILCVPAEEWPCTGASSPGIFRLANLGPSWGVST